MNSPLLYVTFSAFLAMGPLFVSSQCTLSQWATLPLLTDDDNSSLPVLCPNKPGSSDNYFFADPHNCSNFYQCSNGVPVLHECPPGLLFNANCSVCDHPTNVECYETPIQILYPFQEHCTEGDILANVNDPTCNSFIFCTIEHYEDIEGVVMQCPGGLLFNSAEKVCDYPDNVASCHQDSSGKSDDVDEAWVAY